MVQEVADKSGSLAGLLLGNQQLPNHCGNVACKYFRGFRRSQRLEVWRHTLQLLEATLQLSGVQRFVCPCGESPVHAPQLRTAGPSRT